MLRIHWYPSFRFCMKNPGRTWSWKVNTLHGSRGERVWFWGFWEVSWR